MKKENKLKKWIEINFKFLTIFLLLVGVGFSIYSTFARTAGKISDPIGNWPTDDKGYIGHPSDAKMESSDLSGDESVYNLLGKVYEKAGGGETSSCGTCTEKYIATYGYVATTVTGCCTTKTIYSTSAYQVCAAPSGGALITSGSDIYTISYTCYQ